MTAITSKTFTHAPSAGPFPAAPVSLPTCSPPACA